MHRGWAGGDIGGPSGEACADGFLLLLVLVVVQAEQVRSLFTSVFRGPSQALGHMPLSAHVLQLENTTDHALAPSAEQQQQDRSASPALHVRQAAPHSALLALSSPGRVWVLNIDTQAGSTSGSKASEGTMPCRLVCLLGLALHCGG